jgi:hypothetical protein
MDRCQGRRRRLAVVLCIKMPGLPHAHMDHVMVL